MRLKESPDDFEVEEVLGPIDFDPDGAFVLYRADKRGITHHELIRRVARAHDVPDGEVAVCGLKDKVSRARSHLTVRLADPERALRAPPHVPGVRLAALGRMGRPAASSDIAANRFRVVCRDLKRRQVEGLDERVARLLVDGLPGYFDEQRFGGEGEDRGFLAERCEQGDLIGALELLLTRPSPKDPRPTRLTKTAMRGVWPALASALAGAADTAPASLRRPLEQAARTAAADLRGPIAALAAAPHDALGALCAIDRRLRVLLYEHAQSWRWNRTVAAWVLEHIAPKRRFQMLTRSGALWFWRDLDPAQRDLLEALAPRYEPLERAAEALDIRVLGGGRAAWLRPRALAVEAVHEVPTARGAPRQFEVTLTIELPRGAYATLVVKRLFHLDGIVGKREAPPGV